jgi:hypothetical protein
MIDIIFFTNIAYMGAIISTVNVKSTLHKISKTSSLRLLIIGIVAED